MESGSHDQNLRSDDAPEIDPASGDVWGSSLRNVNVAGGEVRWLFRLEWAVRESADDQQSALGRLPRRGELL